MVRGPACVAALRLPALQRDAMSGAAPRSVSDAAKDDALDERGGRHDKGAAGGGDKCSRKCEYSPWDKNAAEGTNFNHFKAAMPARGLTGKPTLRQLDAGGFYAAQA